MSDKNTKNGSIFAPFNIIAMKNVKDKTTETPGLRPLFGCVESIQSAVDDIRAYLQEGPEAKEAALLQGFLKQLTDMQIQLLEVTRSRVQTQNLSPVTPEVEESKEPSILKDKGAEPSPVSALPATQPTEPPPTK